MWHEVIKLRRAWRLHAADHPVVQAMLMTACKVIISQVRHHCNISVCVFSYDLLTAECTCLQHRSLSNDVMIEWMSVCRKYGKYKYFKMDEDNRVASQVICITFVLWLLGITVSDFKHKQTLACALKDAHHLAQEPKRRKVAKQMAVEQRKSKQLSHFAADINWLGREVQRQKASELFQRDFEDYRTKVRHGIPEGEAWGQTVDKPRSEFTLYKSDIKGCLAALY